jgi:hypothetical protein
MGRSHDGLHLLSPRPYTAQTLQLPPPFCYSTRQPTTTSLLELQSRPSLQSQLPTELPHLNQSTIHLKSGRWRSNNRLDNRLKRTIETMTTGVEKIIGKMGLSRPLRALGDSEKSSSALASKRASIHGTTETNSISRPYRSKSRRTKIAHSISQPPSASAACLLTTSNYEAGPSGMETVPTLTTNPLHTIAFPATAGAGARAAVAQHKRSHGDLFALAKSHHDRQFVVPQISSSESSSQRDSLTYADFVPGSSVRHNSHDLELMSTQSWADSMDLDTNYDNLLPGTFC